MNNVIVALATPPFRSALALIRLSGDGVFELTNQLFSKRIEPGSAPKCYVGYIYDDKKPIDNVVIWSYTAPHTATGEDVVEISCHGSPLIANEIISAFLKLGARYATRGEFSSRAFYNGKLDLIEAEAINDMINATTKEAKDLSLLSLKGETSSLVKPLKKSLADLLSLIEVNIDYPEYTDLEDANKEKICSSVSELRKMVSSLLKEGEEGRIIKEGLNVAIVGEPNVGKSSLLNALIKESKALVSDIPGTTRDVVEGDLNLKGIPLHLLDTAGIREGADKLEGLGIEKSYGSIERSDIVVLVVDARKGIKEEEQRIIDKAKGKILVTVYNKDDLITSKDPTKLYISALNNDINPLIEEIYKRIGLNDESFSNPSLSNVRELGLLRRIDQDLKTAFDDASNNTPIDLVSASLMEAYNASRELLGEGTTTDLTDEVFSRFCVGK